MPLCKPPVAARASAVERPAMQAHHRCRTGGLARFAPARGYPIKGYPLEDSLLRIRRYRRERLTTTSKNPVGKLKSLPADRNWKFPSQFVSFFDAFAFHIFVSSSASLTFRIHKPLAEKRKCACGRKWKISKWRQNAMGPLPASFRHFFRQLERYRTLS
jgi:hypothetical protein